MESSGIFLPLTAPQQAELSCETPWPDVTEAGNGEKTPGLMFDVYLERRR